MSAIQFFALLRQLLTFAGSFVVAQGWATSDQYAAIIGAVVTLLSVGWSLYASRKDVLVNKVAELPEVRNVTLTDSPKGEKLAAKVSASNVKQE